jgi:Domain of unknown function (DUF5753)
MRRFAAETGIDIATTSLVENGKRPPSLRIAQACDRAELGRKNEFTELYHEMQNWLPPGFRDWPEIEDKAPVVRVWSPGFLSGLAQTSDYARALLQTVPGVTKDQVEARLANRMARQQRILMREDPPDVWLVVDEMSLYRMVTSPQVMAVQMARLAEVARLPHVTMQILPAREHPANASGLVVTENAAYVEHLVGGLVFTEGQTVSSLQRLMSTIQAESYRASDSLARVEGMTATWTTGARASDQAPKAASALRSRRGKAR